MINKGLYTDFLGRFYLEVLDINKDGTLRCQDLTSFKIYSDYLNSVVDLNNLPQSFLDNNNFRRVA